jgi:hypothetical protein
MNGVHILVNLRYFFSFIHNTISLFHTTLPPTHAKAKERRGSKKKEVYWTYTVAGFPLPRD